MESTRPLLLAAAAMPYVRAASAPPSALLTASHANDISVVKYTAWTWAAIIFALLAYRWTIALLRYVRRLANLTHSSDGRQRFFSIPDQRWAKVKRHLVAAPLFRKRHNREFMLSAALNVGTVPGRLQTIFLLGYLALNVTFCAWAIDWHAPTPEICQMGRNRTGVLATLNMIPLFLLAGRNNPLIWLLGISFDTYNLVHRWIGRIVVLEAVAHTAFWIASKTLVYGSDRGWVYVKAAMGSQMILTGTIGTCAFIAILFQSPSIVRHAFYETFLHVHIILAFISVVTVWIHLNGIKEQSLLLSALVFWIVERSHRLFLIIRNGWGANGPTRAEIEALPGDAIRVTLRMARPWDFHPGQHIYLYLPGIGMWMSHPFSLAWSEDAADFSHEKSLPMSRQDIAAARSSSLSLIIRRRTGFTDALYRKAEAGPITRKAYVEGPYGSQSFQSYGTVMLFAAGVGITHQVPHVRDLVSAYALGTCATRKVVLVWIIQSPEHLEWIRPWMTQILGMDKRREILKILLFVTRPRSTKEIHSPSASVQMFPGKPDVGALIGKEQAQQVGAMAVSVCGTGSLSDDVRRATNERCEVTEIDFSEEAFSW